MVSKADIESYAEKLYEAKQEGKEKEFLETIKKVLTPQELEEVIKKAKMIEERESIFAKLEKLKSTIKKVEVKKEEKPKKGTAEIEFVKAEIKPEKITEEKKEETVEEPKFVSSLEEEEELLPGELPGSKEELPSEREAEKELQLFEEKKLGLPEVAGEKPLVVKELTPAQERAMALDLVMEAFDRGFTARECIEMLLQSGFTKEQTFEIMKAALKKKGLTFK